MSYEENNPPDISIEQVQKSLEKYFPSIEKEDIKFFYHGSYNVFEVMDEYIFRFPDKAFRNTVGYEMIKREENVLNLLRNHLTLKIPKHIFISDNQKNPFVGYKKIEGIPLSWCYNNINSNKTRMQIARDIGYFLTRLHSKVVRESYLNVFGEEDNFTLTYYKKEWEEKFQEIEKVVFPILPRELLKWLKELFTTFLNTRDNFRFTPAVVHGDFDITNILVDPSTFKITGIVDFEEARIYDPVADLLFYDEGTEFQNALLGSYKGNLGMNSENRMKFLYGRAYVPYIVFGLMHNRPEMVEVGKLGISDRMKRLG